MEDAKSNHWRKIKIIKKFALLKVVSHVLLTVVPNHIVNELIKVQTNFIWKNIPAKIKHKTVILDQEIISLQCLWLKKLFDEFFHEWNVIPLFYIKKAFSNNFDFHSSLDYKLRNKVLLPKFFKIILSHNEWFFLLHLQSSPLIFWTNIHGTINKCKLIKNCMF